MRISGRTFRKRKQQKHQGPTNGPSKGEHKRRGSQTSNGSHSIQSMLKLCLLLEVATEPLEDFEQKRTKPGLTFVDNHSGCSIEKRRCRSKDASSSPS